MRTCSGLLGNARVAGAANFCRLGSNLVAAGASTLALDIGRAPFT